MIKVKEHIDKAGIIGVILSHLCCIGFGAQMGLVAPALSGFLMNHRVLLPLFIISIFASMLGVFFSYLKHRNILPFFISAISSAMIIIFSFVIRIEILLYMGLLGLIGASVYNILYTKKIRKKRG